MTSDRAYWLFAILAIAGTACVSVLHMLVIGHVLWVTSNVGLIVCTLKRRQWPLTVMFSVYLVLSIIGLISWSRA